MTASTSISTSIARLVVDGMTCSSCERHVRSALEPIDGVRSVSVSASDGTASVEFDTELGHPAAFVAAVERAGYRARLGEADRPPSRFSRCCSQRPPP